MSGNTEVFELVLEQSFDATEKVRENLFEILNTRCGFRVIKTNLNFDDGPIVVGRNSDPTKLLALQSELVRAGGKVTMLRATEKASNLTIKPSDFSKFFKKYSSGITASLAAMDVEQVQDLAQAMLQARERRSQIFIFGNGGSAANASHFANDLSKQRFPNSRSLFRIISLTDNMSQISASANDEGYDTIFVNQLKNLMQPLDVVIAISSSGNSPNVVKAVEFAKAGGATTFGLVGFDGGALMKAADKSIYIPSEKGQYGFMEDITLVLSHIISVYIFERDAKEFGKK